MSSDKKKEEKKAKRDVVDEVVEELSESSSEEEEMALLGFFELKKGAKGDFKPVYGIVSAGSLFWYKDSRVRLRNLPLSVYSSAFVVRNLSLLHRVINIHANRSEKVSLENIASRNRVKSDGWPKILLDRPRPSPLRASSRSNGTHYNDKICGEMT